MSEAEDTTAGEAAEDVDNMTDDVDITNDWLHRGAFLADLDLHTYIAHVVRIPRPTQARIADIQRVESVFLFDDHYDLANSHWQQLQIIASVYDLCRKLFAVNRHTSTTMRTTVLTRHCMALC